MADFHSPRYWDEQSASFDDEPDHGLRDPVVRGAWHELLATILPDRAAILDIGCGTGSLSLLLAGMGHQVTATDWSPAMIALAQAKSEIAGLPERFFVMDATEPALAAGLFDVVLCRHLLWALPDPSGILRRWVRLLCPHGRLVMIEGFWHTGGGLHAAEVVAALPPSRLEVTVHDLSNRPSLWGGAVTDERYAIVATLRGRSDPSENG